MPVYPGNGRATLLHTNQQMQAWSNEVIPVNAVTSLSQAFQLERVSRSSYPWGASAEVVFGGDPGAFEIDIMGADDDRAPNYNKIGSIIAVNSTFVGRWDMGMQLYPKFLAAFLKTLTNGSVPITLTFTR